LLVDGGLWVQVVFLLLQPFTVGSFAVGASTIGIGFLLASRSAD